VATPVDYKRGSAPAIANGAYDAERVQVCAQGLILREHGFTCDRGIVYFTASKTRVEVVFDDDLVRQTLDAIRGIREAAAAGRIPPPLVDSPKCPRCSLVGICLPDEVNLLRGAPGSVGEARGMAPAREVGLPVHVTEQGAHIGKSGDTLEIRVDRQVAATARLIDVSQVSLYGNVQISAQAVRELADRGIPVCHFSYGGWFSAMTHGMPHKNVELRRRQFALAEREETRLPLCRAFVEGKIRNARTLLRRNHRERPVAALRELARLVRQARACEREESLLGIEGAAARTYFASFGAMLGNEDGLGFDFRQRNRRPPRDPVNAVLSFLYGLLVRDTCVAVMTAGFDPHLGFYHKPRYGRPSLALDLAEEFRPLIADSTALTVIRGGEVRVSDFVMAGGAASLTQRGRRQVIAAYERRMESTVIHPVFGYSISYRKVLSVQARILARVVAGEVCAYPPFCTR
jgi:CRISPR-associated protein Cas1